MTPLYLKIRGDLPAWHPISRVATITLEISGKYVLLKIGEEIVATVSVRDLDQWIHP